MDFPESNFESMSTHAGLEAWEEDLLKRYPGEGKDCSVSDDGTFRDYGLDRILDPRYVILYEDQVRFIRTTTSCKFFVEDIGDTLGSLAEAARIVGAYYAPTG